MAKTESGGVERDEAFADSLFRGPLELGIHRQVDLQPGSEERVRSVGLLDLLTDVLEKVRAALHVLAVELGAERLGDRRVVGLTIDELELEHAVEHPVAAIEGALGPPDRVELVVCAGDHPSQQSGLGERQVDGGLVEVEARGGLRSVGAMAEEDLIRIHRDDLVLRQAFLHVESQEHFL